MAHPDHTILAHDPTKMSLAALLYNHRAERLCSFFFSTKDFYFEHMFGPIRCQNLASNECFLVTVRTIFFLTTGVPLLFSPIAYWYCLK